MYRPRRHSRHLRAHSRLYGRPRDPRHRDGKPLSHPGGPCGDTAGAIAGMDQCPAPRPAFDMQMPELAAEGFDYAILRRNADNARKDVLSWGEPASGGPYVLVEIYRPGTANERFIDAPSEIAARIVGFTITDDVKPAGQIDSKFGAVSPVDFTIAVPGNHNGRQRRCLGFARPFSDPPLQIAGWYCNADEKPVDSATLAPARPAHRSVRRRRCESRCFVRTGRAQAHFLRRAQSDSGGDAGTRCAGADTAPVAVYRQIQAALALGPQFRGPIDAGSRCGRGGPRNLLQPE